MRSRVKRYTQKEMYMLCDEVQEVIDDVINANSALFIVTLARMGWGKKRLRDFIGNYNSVNSEYAQYSREGVFDHYLTRELERAGVTYDEVLPKSKIGFKERLREDRKKKNSLSVVEAMKTQNALKTVQGLLEKGQANDR